MGHVERKVAMFGRTSTETVTIVLPFDGAPFAGQQAARGDYYSDGDFHVMHVPTTTRVPGSGCDSIDDAVRKAAKLSRDCPSAPLVKIVGDGKPFKTDSVPQMEGPAGDLEREVRASLKLSPREEAA